MAKSKHSELIKQQQLDQKRIASGLFGVLIVAISGILLVFASRAATQQIYLTPTTGSVLQGNSIAVQVRVAAGANTVNAAEARITYNPSQLQYVGVNETGSAFPLVAATTVTSGVVDVTRSISGGGSLVTGDVLLTTVTFKALAGSGSSTLQVTTGSHLVYSYPNPSDPTKTISTDYFVSGGSATYALTSSATPTPAATPVPTTAKTPTPTPTVAATKTPTPTATPVISAGTLYITPANSSVATGATVSVQIRENSGSTAVNAVQANVSYDPSRLEYVGVDASGADFDLAARTTTAAGLVSLTRGVSGGKPAVTGDKLVGKVTFRALAPLGSTNLGFATGSAIASATGGDITKTKTGASVTVVASSASAPAKTTPSAAVNAAQPTAKPDTAVVVAITGTSKVVPVSGVIKLTMPSTAGTVTYKLDGKEIGDVLDTSTLRYGVHTITATTTTNGKTVTITQKIFVNSKATSLEKLIAGAQQQLPAIMIVLVLIVLGGVGIGWVVLHSHGIQRTTAMVAPQTNTTGGTQSIVGSSTTTIDPTAGPAPEIIYPDSTNKPE